MSEMSDDLRRSIQDALETPDFFPIGTLQGKSEIEREDVTVEQEEERGRVYLTVNEPSRLGATLVAEKLESELQKQSESERPPGVFDHIDWDSPKEGYTIRFVDKSLKSNSS